MPKRNATPLTKRLIETAPNDSSVWDVQVPGFGIRTTAAGHRSFIFQYRSRSGAQLPEMEAILRIEMLEPRGSTFPRSDDLSLRAPKPLKWDPTL